MFTINRVNHDSNQNFEFEILNIKFGSDCHVALQKVTTA